MERKLYLISIHPPRAGRDGFPEVQPPDRSISIHPPRAGRDMFIPFLPPAKRHFNPPAPCGAGPVSSGCRRWSDDFNPPAPCGAGLGCFGKLPVFSIFQSTRPVRGGTAIMHKIYSMHFCVIHNLTCSQATVCISASAFTAVMFFVFRLP